MKNAHKIFTYLLLITCTCLLFTNVSFAADSSLKPLNQTSLKYEGLADVSNVQIANGKTVTGLHHYSLDYGYKNKINIYVTDEYKKSYPDHYGYGQIEEYIRSIYSFKKFNPMDSSRGAFNIYFYTNKNYNTFQSQGQASVGRYNDNQPFEMKINASAMPYDFRITIYHELVHYFDLTSELGDNDFRKSFQNYWGNYYGAFVLEGAAEYATYFVGKIDKMNGMNEYLRQIKTREDIINYAQQQSRDNSVIKNIKITNFNSLYEVSGNNYGVYTSFYYYMVQTFSLEKVQSYVHYIGKNFSNKNVSEEVREETAKKFFGKTEATILNDWLKYFNNFDRELGKDISLKKGTINHLFTEKSSVLPGWIKKDMKSYVGKGEVPIIINVKEWDPNGDYTQVHKFRENVTKTIKLVYKKDPPITLTLNGSTFNMGPKLSTGEYLNSFLFTVNSKDYKRIKKNVPYKLEVKNNKSGYSWIVPKNFTVKF